MQYSKYDPTESLLQKKGMIVIKYVYFVLCFMTSQSTYCPEELTDSNTIAHVSTRDESFIRNVRIVHNKIGAWIGKHTKFITKKTGVDLGFGDIHHTQKLLANHNRSITQNFELTQHINQMNAHEKTIAIQLAREHAAKPQQVTADAFHILSDKEALQLHDDKSVTVHDLETFDNDDSMSKTDFDSATHILNQYLKDPTNLTLQANAKKIFDTTNYLKVATRAQQQELLTNYFELSKLFDNPQKFKKAILSSNKSTIQAKKLVSNTIAQYFENPNNSPDNAQDLLTVYNDQEKTNFLQKYLNDPANEARIMQLIGADHIIVGDTICNIYKPKFTSTQQAIDTAIKLCDKQQLTQAQATALRNILQSMNYSDRNTVLKKYSKTPRNNILKQIKNDDELIINNQIVNIKNPEHSLYTQNPQDFVTDTITTLMRSSPLSHDQQTALQNFTTFAYRNNPAIVAETMDQLTPTETVRLKKLLPTHTIILADAKFGTILIDPTDLKLETSIQTQAENILKNMNLDTTNTQAIELIRQTIAQHFQKQFGIVDITSAQNACEKLLYANRDFSPDIFQAILKQLRTPKTEQANFFTQIMHKLSDEATKLETIIDETPETYQESYGIAGGTMVKRGIEREESQLSYIYGMQSKFQKLIEA